MEFASLLGAVVVILFVVFALVIWSIYKASLAQINAAWHRAVSAQDAAAGRAIEETKVHRDQLAVVLQWTCHLAGKIGTENMDSDQVQQWMNTAEEKLTAAVGDAARQAFAVLNRAHQATPTMVPGPQNPPRGQAQVG